MVIASMLLRTNFQIDKNTSRHTFSAITLIWRSYTSKQSNGKITLATSRKTFSQIVVVTLFSLHVRSIIVENIFVKKYIQQFCYFTISA